MRFLLAVVLAVVLACEPALHAVAGTPADPAMHPPTEHLPPKLLRAKAELRSIVARRDMEALLARVRPETRLDFGGDEGVEGFQAAWNGDAESRQRLWSTLESILALPGISRRFDHGDEYCAPYVFCTGLPGDVDPFEALVVLGSGVAIRDRPSTSGNVLTRVDHVVLRASDDPGSVPTTDWTRVRLADGTAGYIHSRWVRKPDRLPVRAAGGRWRRLLVARLPAGRRLRQAHRVVNLCWRNCWGWWPSAS